MRETVFYPIHPQGLSYSLQSPPRSEHSASHTRGIQSPFWMVYTHTIFPHSVLFFFSNALLPVFSLPQRTSQMQFQFHTFRAGGFHSQLLCKLSQSLVKIASGQPLSHHDTHPRSAPHLCTVKATWGLAHPLDNVEMQPTCSLAGKAREDMERRED